MEKLNEIKVYATTKEAYQDLYDNVTAMLLAQGMNPKCNKDEMYITFDNNNKSGLMREYIQQEVEVVFGKNNTTKRFCLKAGKTKYTLTFIASGRWE